MANASGCDDLIHLIRSISLGIHWNAAPRAAGITVRVAVLTRAPCVARDAVARMFPITADRRIDEDVIVHKPDGRAIVARVTLLPHNCCHEAIAPEHFVHHYFEIRLLAVVTVNPDRPIIGKQFLHLNETVAHHGQPDRVLKGVIVVQEGLTRVEGRVQVRELHLADVLSCEFWKLAEAI